MSRDGQTGGEMGPGRRLEDGVSSLGVIWLRLVPTSPKMPALISGPRNAVDRRAMYRSTKSIEVILDPVEPGIFVEGEPGDEVDGKPGGQPLDQMCLRRLSCARPVRSTRERNP